MNKITDLARALRVAYKRWKSGRRLVPAFCKRCGRDVHDFVAPDDVWKKVADYTGMNVLCYDCFCDVCEEIGEQSVWRLEILY